MLCRRIFERINFENSRESLLSKTFKITDIAGQEAIFLKDDEGNEFVLEATKDRKLNLDKFQTPDERIDYLEDLVVTLLERIGIDEEQLHELTEKRLYGNEDQEVKEGKTA